MSRLFVVQAACQSRRRNLKLRRLYALGLVFVFIISASLSAQAMDNVTLYRDALASNWANWSWETNLDLANSTPVQAGNASLAVTYNTAWAAVYLHTDELLSGNDFNRLRFWVHGGSGPAKQLQVLLYDGNQAPGPAAPVTARAGSWSQIELPLTNLGNPAQISGIAWQDGSGGAQGTFYLDEITLLSGVAPSLPSGGLALQVNAAAGQHPISPYIYGMNFADESLARELRLPVRRWGGNAATRYNWQTDTSNRARDWYFENIANPNTSPGNLPLGSASDQFVEQDRRTGAKTLMTVPLLGWTPKRGLGGVPYDCAFKVSKYGPQQATDPYDPDCGNGVKPDGSLITHNDPADTSLPVGPDFVQSWLKHLIGRYGSAAQGGVLFYNLDNEPMLWNLTHRDIHPHPAGYDEIRDRTYQYAAAIKAIDPGALTLGPVSWGWTEYFYSALDAAPGGNWWENPQDRKTHGGQPFIEWYLQQMRAYEQDPRHPIRILDYLDLHYYPQASQVALSPAGDAATQALRLRSTRSLWDPTYLDESWINEPVYLIPRMRAWVEQNYAGTKLALTEYNWGALDHLNGALTQADVLGIFGREGLDLATLWEPPDLMEPGAFAFKMYLNYDGAGSSFGDTSVSAVSPNPDQLALYAAQRQADGALTLMVINKSNSDLASTVTLAGFDPAPTAQVYRYSGQDLNAIRRLPEQAMNANNFSTIFPAVSITLLVVPPANYLVSSEITQVHLPVIVKPQ